MSFGNICWVPLIITSVHILFNKQLCWKKETLFLMFWMQIFGIRADGTCLFMSDCGFVVVRLSAVNTFCIVYTLLLDVSVQCRLGVLLVCSVTVLIFPCVSHLHAVHAVHPLLVHVCVHEWHQCLCYLKGFLKREPRLLWWLLLVKPSLWRNLA